MMRVVCGALLLGVLASISFGQTTPPNMKAGPTSVGGKTLAQWKLDLTSADPSRRAEAVIAITGFGNANAECVPALIGVMSDRDVSPRVRAVIAMRMVHVEDRDMGKVITALVARLDKTKESQAVVRLEAVVSLQHFVKEAAIHHAVPGLIKGTHDTVSWEIRYHCVAALWRAGREQKSGTDAAIYEALLSVLTNDKVYLVRLETLQGLGSLGRPNNNPVLLNKVVTSLNAYARLENKALAIWAYSALVAMQDATSGDLSLGAIAKFLKSERLETRIQAANALGALGARSKKSVPRLLDMLKDAEANGVWAACNALSGIGESNNAIVDALMDLLAHKEPSRSAAAVTALVNLRVNTTRVTEAFDKMRENKDLDIKLRNYIEQALPEIKKPKK